MSGELQPQDVLSFWLPLEDEIVFQVSEDFDNRVRTRFAVALEQARAGALDHWEDSAEGSLALVILLDQMSRNIYRGKADAFDGDAKARQIARAAIAAGFDRLRSDPDHRRWYYLPFEHSESIDDQELCVKLFRTADLQKFLPWAIEHRDIIRRFARFPHRNAVLGRISSPDELAYLAAGGFKG